MDEDVNKCAKCHENEAKALHPCPYKTQINDDDSLCDCCEECEDDCRDNI